MSKNFRRYYETAFDSKISKSDEDLLSADKHDAAIAHRLSNQLQLSASASSVRPCDVVVRASPSKPPGKSRLFGFLLRRRRRNSGGARGAGQYNNYRSSDSVATSSSLSLESITSDSLSSHSSESPRCYPQPHVLSPISDKSSLDAGAEISDYERDRRLSATAAAQIKTKPPQSLGLIKLNRDHSQHHGSDSGISVGSKPGDNYQELLDVPFDMPKLRRKQKSEVSHAEKSGAVTAAVATVTLPSAADECPPSGLPPFDMPKLRRKLVPDDAHNSSVDVALPFDVLRKRQMDSCARVISFDFEINNDDADHLHAYCPDSANVMDIAGRNVADGTFPERLEALPFDVPKLNKINSLRDGGDKKPDRNSLFLDVKSNDCAAVTINNRPSLKTFQNKNQPNRPTLSLCNIKPLNFVEDIDVSLPLDQQCWYHGFMTRIEAEKILRGKEEGTYLVRGNKGLYALSIKSAKGFIHMRITQSGERNYLGQSDRPFDTIPDLIRHYTLNKLPAKGAEHVGLIRPLAYQIL